MEEEVGKLGEGARNVKSTNIAAALNLVKAIKLYAIYSHAARPAC